MSEREEEGGGEEEEQPSQLEHWRVCIPFMLPPLLTLSSGLFPELSPALYPRLPLALSLSPFLPTPITEIVS